MRISKLFLVLFLLISIASILSAQSSLVLMAISAHPDDEDGAALAYYAKIKGVKTYSVFFTRGEGGQNEVGSALGDDLGVLRTQETRAAAQVLGSEVIFLGYPDFGFSKTAKETFAMWGDRDSVLARLVYVIRALKPDVIITNHDTITTKPNRQHGNHQAAGITAYEAFRKAANPSYHPEQLNGVVTPWQVKKLYYRFFNRGGIKQDSLVSLDVNAKDASGKTIEQISMEALSKHRSQGMDKITLDSIPSFFRKHSYYKVLADSAYPYDQSDLFSGISPSDRQQLAASSINMPLVVLKEPPPVDLKLITATPPQNVFIGLIATYDTTTEHTLKTFNIKYQLIDSTKLSSGDLSAYTTIVLDLRTYEYRNDVRLLNGKLLSYAHDGGNIVCFYHKSFDWNGKNYAPYPLTLTTERVTEETAPVQLLIPQHPLMTTPNRITENDWGEWVQERSIYLPSDDTTKTSSQYARLLAMSDTDEKQPSTSLLYAQYGKGTYSYCALALYRQLRNYNQGAVKLFFNLISQKRGM